jgi:hypothetical protein
MSGFEHAFKMKSLPNQTPRFFKFSRTGSESWEVTIYGVKLSPAAEMHAITDKYFKFRLILWWISGALIDLGTITLFDFRFSHSEIPTSSRLKISSVGRLLTSSLMHRTVSSTEWRGTSRRCASCGYFCFIQFVQMVVHERINPPARGGEVIISCNLFS